MVDAHIGAAFARLTRDQAAAKLRAANTAYGFVNDVADFAHHPALRRAEVGTPNGPVSIAAPPVLWSDGPRDARSGAGGGRAFRRHSWGICWLMRSVEHAVRFHMSLRGGSDEARDRDFLRSPFHSRRVGRRRPAINSQ